MASSDTFKAYQWIRENQDRFQKEVFGPPMVTCSIKDPRYADIIESLFQKSDFTAFTTQSREDFVTLQRALYRELKLHDITLRTCTVGMDRMRPPVSDSEIHRLGFDGWAKDYLNGPEPVLAMLCTDNGLHQIPVSLTENSPDAYSYLERQSAIATWVEGRTFHKISRRREYNNATSTLTRDLKSARVWTTQPLDVTLQQQYRDEIDKFEQQKDEIDNKIDSIKTSLRQLKEDDARLSREMVSLALLPSFCSCTDQICSNRLRMKRPRSKLRTRSTEPFPRKLVCLIKWLVRLSSSTDTPQPNKRPSAATCTNSLRK